MVVIGFVLLGLGLVVTALLALADPVLLSRINGEDAEGGSGRHIDVEVVRLSAAPAPAVPAGTASTPKAA
ncbi:hypothetical protein DMB42_21005 [Nonomuraea sp. WAC 01424]|uniref:hypothetical protein n=1 Tax=Nonomuraea sp. WAC 01424 TaxID=2203200 RepID=UPI000F794E64|nr:hypothetical protein [Nonomuraea sp. WAC 01424]RSN08501.1 hypothetical protein DMB42_21005 [Nonomuraea sp. WAC 01424]